MFAANIQTGNPISDLEYGVEGKKDATSTEKFRKPSEITLMRSRMFYARPPMTSKGHIQPGFRHIRESPGRPFSPLYIDCARYFKQKYIYF